MGQGLDFLLFSFFSNSSQQFRIAEKKTSLSLSALSGFNYHTRVFLKIRDKNRSIVNDLV